jgi:hypothetical protein
MNSPLPPSAPVSPPGPTTDNAESLYRVVSALRADPRMEGVSLSPEFYLAAVDQADLDQREPRS